MARKYTKLKFMDDEDLIKKMINHYCPDIRFIKISYVRDDRVVDLRTNEVHIGQHADETYGNTKTLYKHGGEIAMDDLANATLSDNNMLIGKKVYVELCDSDNCIHLKISDDVVANFERGSFSFPNIDNIDEFIDIIASIDGCDWIAREMKIIQPYYGDNGIYFLSKMWHVVNKYNLFDLLDEYSNLFTYHCDLFLDSSKSNFFEAAGLPNEFLFRLTNYYLNARNGRDDIVRNLKTDRYLYSFYDKLPEECKSVFLQEAEKERYDIAMICGVLSYKSQEILEYATRSPIFFNDYMKYAKTHESQEGILSAFARDAKSLDSYNLPFDFSSLTILKYEKKAKDMRISTNELFDLVKDLDSKEGLLNYLQYANKEY